MTESVYTLRLSEPGSRGAAIDLIRVAPDNAIVEIRKATRTNLQNRFAHAVWTDLEEGARFAERALRKQQWKALMVSGHSIATGRPSDLVTGIEGEWVDLRESTARMPIARMASVIDYSLAWMAVNNVPLRKVSELRRERP